MTDRELLEMAAKAAGIDGEYRTERLCIAEDWMDVTAIFFDGGMRWWNPLEDDGDALRLAVKLNLLTTECVEDWKWCRDKTEHADVCASYRRAIVRAAAEIGKGMK